VQQHAARRPAQAVAVELLPQLRRARDHIDRHYQQPLDLAGLAAVAGVSKFHFARCFEATYGETPIRYLTRRRIERAQDLLRVANLTVTEICMVVGFASLGSFSSRFAQLVGESPELEVTLMTPGPPLTADAAAFVRRQLEAGQMAGLGLRVDDCRKTYAELAAKDVTFLQEPSERPYGVEAVMRDVSGNWMVLVEPREFTPGEAS
jgi:AraC-like DNA-binding protein